jgi:hypothetical protein
MNELRAIVDALLADPLGPARARAQGGERVVGLLGEDIPIELVRAAGAAGLQLAGLQLAKPQLAEPQPGGPPADEGTTPHADRYLETSFPPAVRSTVEAWLTGAFDFLDSIIFSRSNDSIQRIYYYLCELQRRGLTQGPRPLLYDLAKIPRPSSRRHTRLATRRLASELGVNTEALPEAIRVRNRRRRLLRELEQLRATDRPPCGTDVYRVLRASDLLTTEPRDAGVAAFDEALADWIHNSATQPPHQSPHESPRGPRLLLAGSVPPDERLHAAVERGGGCVVGEVGSHSPARLGDPVPLDPTALDPAGLDPARHPIDALSDHHHALCFGPRAFCDRAQAIRDDALRVRADGVVLWLIEEDESMAWDVPPIRQALAATNIAHLVLTRRRADCTDGALDHVTEFVASLHGRSGHGAGPAGRGVGPVGPSDQESNS